MRTTTPLSITFPPEMLKRAKKLAGKENRTMSELMREAYREYERKRRWDDLNEYGREKAATLGITESDVPGIVKGFRKGNASIAPATPATKAIREDAKRKGTSSLSMREIDCVIATVRRQSTPKRLTIR